MKVNNFQSELTDISGKAQRIKASQNRMFSFEIKFSGRPQIIVAVLAVISIRSPQRLIIFITRKTYFEGRLITKLLYLVLKTEVLL